LTDLLQPSLFVSAAALLTVTTAGLTGVCRFLLRRGAEPTREWFDNFDLQRYQGLTQLFDPQDFNFLKSQPGYSPDLTARLKSDRLKIAESYLRQLENDVRLLLNFVNRANGSAESEEQDFSGFVLKQEFKFAITMAWLRAELALMKVGVVQRVKFGNLIESLRPLVQCSQTLAVQFS
jgi:hypothetical protein